MFGLHFGEFFIVCFVLITVIAAPYVGKVGEGVAGLFMPRRPVDTGSRVTDRGPSSVSESAGRGPEEPPRKVD